MQQAPAANYPFAAFLLPIYASKATNIAKKPPANLNLFTMDLAFVSGYF